MKGFLEYILDNISSNNIGICYDVGHANLFFEGNINVERFKNRVFAIHLHDNFKETDDHNLPFDGTVDWDKSIKQIIDLNYNDYVVMECGYSDFYKAISMNQYYEKAYSVGLKLVELLNEKQK